MPAWRVAKMVTMLMKKNCTLEKKSKIDTLFKRKQEFGSEGKIVEIVRIVIILEIYFSIILYLFIAMVIYLKVV